MVDTLLQNNEKKSFGCGWSFVKGEFVYYNERLVWLKLFDDAFLLCR